jgi:hypothetical protein
LILFIVDRVGNLMDEERFGFNWGSLLIEDDSFSVKTKNSIEI